MHRAAIATKNYSNRTQKENETIFRGGGSLLSKARLIINRARGEMKVNGSLKLLKRTSIKCAKEGNGKDSFFQSRSDHFLGPDLTVKSSNHIHLHRDEIITARKRN